jgi:hypothetical protein
VALLHKIIDVTRAQINWLLVRHIVGCSNGPKILDAQTATKYFCSLLQIKVTVVIRCQIMLPFAKLRLRHKYF